MWNMVGKSTQGKPKVNWLHKVNNYLYERDVNMEECNEM